MGVHDQPNFDLKKMEEAVNGLANAKDLPVIGSKLDPIDLNVTARFLRTTLQQWAEKKDEKLEVYIATSLEQLYKVLYPLPPGYAYVTNLHKLNPTFKGATHCEASLASLLDDFTTHGTKSKLVDYAKKKDLSGVLSDMKVNMSSFIIFLLNLQLSGLQNRVLREL